VILIVFAGMPLLGMLFVSRELGRPAKDAEANGCCCLPHGGGFFMPLTKGACGAGATWPEKACGAAGSCATGPAARALSPAGMRAAARTLPE
jgi:hypothetical protein